MTPTPQEYAIETGQYVLIAVADTVRGHAAGSRSPRPSIPSSRPKAPERARVSASAKCTASFASPAATSKSTLSSGVGTSVKIYLPRLYGEAAATEQAKRLATIHRGLRSEVVLVVEDDERVRALSVEALRELGYSVVEASGPTQALRMLDEGQQVNLLFTDVVMPDMSGRQLADRAREKRPKLKVLYTTGYTRNAIVHNGMLDPGTNLLTKPFSIEALAAKNCKILDNAP